MHPCTKTPGVRANASLVGCKRSPTWVIKAMEDATTPQNRQGHGTPENNELIALFLDRAVLRRWPALVRSSSRFDVSHFTPLFVARGAGQCSTAAEAPQETSDRPRCTVAKE